MIWLKGRFKSWRKNVSFSQKVIFYDIYLSVNISFTACKESFSEELKDPNMGLNIYFLVKLNKACDINLSDGPIIDKTT